METQVLAVHQSYGVVKSLGVGAVTASLGRQQHWHFRVEKKVTLQSSRRKRSNVVQVRAKKSGIGFKLPGTLKLKNEEPISESEDPPAPAKGTQKLGKLPGTLKFPGRERSRPKDNKVVFVAGATGKVGQRTVRELLQLGFYVRAGVRNVDRAQFLLEFSPGTKPEEAEKPPSLWSNFSPEKIFSFLGSAKKEPGVELVEIDLENPEDIEAALGNAGVVVCAIGASEKEALDATGPFRIDFKATENLIRAATSAKVNHFVLVTSLGTKKVGWPAAVLNLFWGVLIWKAKAEKALIESGIPFTIVRPGGMERPTDTYKETHNLLLDKADSRFGGQVSNLQVAELIAGIVSNLKLAQNKVLEVVAETTAPLRPIEDLLSEIPSISVTETDQEEITGRKKVLEEEKLARREELKAAKQREEEEKLARREELKAAKRREEEERQAAEDRLAAEKEKAEALRQKLQSQYLEAKEREEEAKREAAAALSEKEEIEKRAADLRLRAGAAVQAAREAKALEVAITAAARQGKTLSEAEKKDIITSVREQMEAESKQKESKVDKAAEAKARAAEEKEKAAKKLEEAKAAEQKQKVEAEKKAKAEAEMKAKAEAEEKAKADAEMKAKAEAEADEKKRVEAAEKAKAEAEEKARVEAETRVKAEAEAEEKSRVEAAEKAKAEAEEKARVEAEIKAKEEPEAEEKLRVEAAAKTEPETEIPSKEEESQAVEAIASGALSQEKEVPKPFRWPWQKEDSSEDTISESQVEKQEPSEDIISESQVKEENSNELPRASAPLSPFVQYPGLKPPTSPSPPKVETKVVASVAEVIEDVTGEPDKLEKEEPVDDKEDEEVLQKLGADATAESKAREELALEKAKSSGGAAFRWPWQKAEPAADMTIPGAVETISTSLETGSLGVINETASPGDLVSASINEKLPTAQETEDFPRTSRPLSPYTRYPGLKPPTTPGPPPTTESQAETEVSPNGSADLQPPSSVSPPSTPPSPASPDNVEQETAESAAIAAEIAREVAAREQAALEMAKETTGAGFVWPWQKSTEPSSEETATIPDSTDLPRTSRPLSPYWRYPGLKPPSSPTPSAPKSKLMEESKDAIEESSNSEEGKEEEKEEVLETISAGGFRWPWQ